MIAISSARILVQMFLSVENMFVKEDVILVIVENVHFRGRGLVLVEKECMKECPATLQRLFVVALVASC